MNGLSVVHRRNARHRHAGPRRMHPGVRRGYSRNRACTGVPGEADIHCLIRRANQPRPYKQACKLRWITARAVMPGLRAGAGAYGRGTRETAYSQAYRARRTSVSCFAVRINPAPTKCRRARGVPGCRLRVQVKLQRGHKDVLEGVGRDQQTRSILAPFT